MKSALPSGMVLLVSLWGLPALTASAVWTPPIIVSTDAATCDEPHEGKDPHLCPHARALLDRLEAEGQREAGLREGDDDTDVTHYSLAIEIIPEYSGSSVTAVGVEGTCVIDVESTVDGLEEFTVDLRDNLTVSDVTGNVDSWSRVGHTVQIMLDQVYDAGQAFQVRVVYEGYPQTSGFAAFKWWTRNDNLVVATLSEPYYAHYWWPCKDALNDKSTMQINVTVPDPMIAISNGDELDPQVLLGERTRYRWHETYPMVPYLASLAITNYKRYELEYTYESGGTRSTMPVPCFVYPDHWDFDADEPLPGYKDGCDELVTMLDVLGDRYGLYPFVAEKYGVAETGGSGGIGASMEHQTISSMSAVADYSDIMAHELAHQWWGDEVTCETWYDIWLNEGFASYSESLYREFMPGGGLASFWSRVNDRRPTNPDGRVYRTSIASVASIFSTNDVYRKGSWVLHMLRHVVGDDAFFVALADYRAVYRHDSATTEEFAALISESFGRDLTWFVDQWVMEPGSPDYEWNYEAARIQGEDYLKLFIRQTQDDEGYGLFVMPVDIRVTTDAGSTVHTVWNDDWMEY